MKKDRLGLVLIAASLIAIAVVGTLAYRSEVRLQRQNIRVNGIAMVRTIAEMESVRSGSAEFAGLDVQALPRSPSHLPGNDGLLYVVVADSTGRTLRELVSPGSIVPAATMPTDALAGPGELTPASSADRLPIREFFAPVLRNGQLAGFVRAGYVDTYHAVGGHQLSLLGLLALPIFLLAALAYSLLRREIEPVSQLCDKLNNLSHAYGVEPYEAGAAGGKDDLLRRFDTFMKHVQARVESLDLEKADSQTAVRLISYKHEKSEYALNSLPDAIVVLDDTGTATFANQKMEQLLSRRREELVGMPATQWCENREVLAFLMRHKQASAAGRSGTHDYTPDGQPERRVRIAAIPLFAPRDRSNLSGMMFVFRDISVEHLAGQSGSDFVSHVAHELKTPLNALLGYSELLLHRSTLPEAEQVNAVNVIRSETERMAALINNLLNISKMEGGSLKPERARVRLNDLIQDAFQSLHNSALGKSVELELAIAPDLGSVRLDKHLFRIAIDNLLSNAIKYSNPGGRVAVSVGMLDDGQIQIRVRDQGIGISAEDCRRIFEKYYRSSSDATIERTGHGLGLYLAKQIVELHQGTISVASELGKGTEFTVTLQAQPVMLEMSEAV